MVGVAETINKFTDFMLLNWYWFLIPVLFIIIFVMISKIKKLQKKQHNEIARHHELVTKEEKFNKTPFTFLYIGNRLMGKIKSKKMKSELTYKDTYTDKKVKIRKCIGKQDFLVITIADKMLGFNKDFAFWTGKKHFVIPEDKVTYKYGKDIVIDGEIDIELYEGYFMPSNYRAEFTYKFIDSEFHKTNADLQVNAFGNQMLQLSSTDSDNAHEIHKVEKVKELEETKKKKEVWD